MADAICSIDGCDREAKKRGWCIRHYRRWQRHGNPTAGRVNAASAYAGALCSVNGCERPAAVRALCRTHYRRLLLYGDVVASVPIRSYGQPQIAKSAGPRPISMHNAAWLAGLFEGEGTIIIAQNRFVKLVLGMTDRDVIEKIDALIPTPHGPRHRPKQKPHHKDQWIGYAHGASVVEATLKAMLPWFGERRRGRALEALYVLSHRHPGAQGHHQRAKTHCAHGHPYNEANTYVNSRGQRSCRICKREDRRRFEARVRDGGLLGR